MYLRPLFLTVPPEPIIQRLTDLFLPKLAPGQEHPIRLALPYELGNPILVPPKRPTVSVESPQAMEAFGN